MNEILNDTSPEFDRGKIVPSGSTEFQTSRQVQGCSMHNGVKTLSTHFTSLVYIKSFFIKLTTNLSLQVLIFIQDFRLMGVIIIQSQRQLALTCSREVCGDNCSFDLCYKSESLVLIFELKFSIFIHLPHILEVQHHDFVFGNRVFLHANIAYFLLIDNSYFLILATWILNNCSQMTLVDFHPNYCVPTLDEFQLVLFDPGGTFLSKHDIPFHGVYYYSPQYFHHIPILCSNKFSSSPISFSHYLILMHLCWFSGCRGKVRGRTFLGKAVTSF